MYELFRDVFLKLDCIGGHLIISISSKVKLFKKLKLITSHSIIDDAIALPSWEGSEILLQPLDQYFKLIKSFRNDVSKSVEFWRGLIKLVLIIRNKSMEITGNWSLLFDFNGVFGPCILFFWKFEILWGLLDDSDLFYHILLGLNRHLDGLDAPGLLILKLFDGVLNLILYLLNLIHGVGNLVQGLILNVYDLLDGLVLHRLNKVKCLILEFFHRFSCLLHNGLMFIWMQNMVRKVL